MTHEKNMQPQTKKLTILFVVLGVLILLSGLVAYTAYAVYSKANDNVYTRLVGRALPVAKVGSKTVSYYKFLTMRDAINKFINGEAGKAAGVTAPPENELNKNIVDRLARILVLQELGQQKNVSISDDDVRAVFADVVKVAASSTTPNVADYLYKNYGWNEEDFRQEVLRPALLEQKLAIELAKEKNGDMTALETAITDRLSKSDVVFYIKF
jgi:hypothetical protein